MRPGGEPTVVESGTLATVPGLKPRSMSAVSPVAEGGTVSVSLAGVPGDVALLGFTTSQGAQFHPELHGTLLLALPFTVATAGSLPPGGTLHLKLPVGLLPTGVMGLSLVGQAAFFSAAGPVFVGSGSAVLLTDGSVPLD